VTIFELKDMSLIEFAFEILDKGTKLNKPKKKSKDKEIEIDILKELSGKKESSGRKPARKRLVNKKSKITKKEVNEVRRFLNGAKTHEEVLVAMGLSPEQISKYSYKKGKDK
jgi:DNA-binding CsgD family transcriptional regulator